MSKINILRAVENIRSRTTAYTPLIESVVNAIQTIKDKNSSDGRIDVVVERSNQEVFDHGKPSVESLLINDNGTGFTDENRESFDTLFSDHRISEGGKGFGRFICLKYFENVEIESVYQDKSEYKFRTFKMGKGNDIIVDEKIRNCEETNTRTVVKLLNVKEGKFVDKKLATIARVLMERLLPYFIGQGYSPPIISVAEGDGSEKIILNQYLSNKLADSIKEITVTPNNFTLAGNDVEHRFMVRLFKFYSPKNQRSRVSLVAHRREVTETALHKYIPEFVEEFYDKKSDGSENNDRNYIVKAYVFGDYLDDNVSLERGGFEFQSEGDMLHPVSQDDIEDVTARMAREAIGDEINVRQERKRERVQAYVDDEAPWHRSIIEKIDMAKIPYQASNREIELKLQEEKIRQEAEISEEVNKLLKEGDIDALMENVTELVKKISESSRNDLVHYIAFRRKVLKLLSKKLELDPDGSYSSEGAIHDIIFPRREDVDSVPFDDHNLWIIDERLNFTKYVTSDSAVTQIVKARPDLLAYDRRVLFRGDNEASNPVTIFEFKRPQRDDFANPASVDDPIKQIVRYVNRIREGHIKTVKGRDIMIAQNTPFFGYVVCDLTPKVERWLEFEENFKPKPDKRAWFSWRENINLYLEVISWDKVLSDAEMRNRIFFHKLGIS